MTEQDISNYLKEHPDFFIHHPELLTSLNIPHLHQGTTSLVEWQLNQQRSEIKALKQLLEKFHQLAHQDADIFFALLPLQKKLFAADGFQSVLKILDNWAKEYELAGVSILLFRDSWQAIDGIPQHCWLDRKAFELIRLERMGLRQCYLGDLSNKEKALLFLPEELPIGSVAICRLTGSAQRPSALLVFKSRDTAVFHNGQDTVFLRHIIDIAALHLSPWLASCDH